MSAPGVKEALSVAEAAGRCRTDGPARTCWPPRLPAPLAALTFWSPVLSLAALSFRLTSSPGSRGHWDEPVGLFLAGGLWATSTTTPGEAVMLKDV